MNSVGPAIVLKSLALLPHAVSAEDLVTRLERAFGEEGFLLEDGRSLPARELVEALLKRGDLIREDGGLRVSPDWGCRRKPDSH